ncbi:sigma-70 family RNA polymerase sigma factor [Chitinophagaceae bacterium LB-8]|uniref:Sigma-70 family RNA polymerase sigma factor n=1 Tax=Paraflavisolibacter caeni TaxID=2982496 RepID=A0A9X2XNV2_9BACT|nr:sigma-70 family RNA polymerase sigma factor [Paraflavisolibacter caeni]MCU7549718.1 sigma-70 family RNA polymerase sigma factor [Paraflavisolibacter caeni]
MLSFPPLTENDVMLRFADGDRKAFETIYHQYYLSVFRFAKRLVIDRAAAEDITTETFLKLWKKRSDFADPQKLKSFLFITAKNACLNHLRSEKRQGQNQLELENALADQTETNFLQHEITECVYQFLYEEIDRLPLKMKTILKLQLVGMKNDEISVHMNIAEKTVRNLKVEAIKQLRVAFFKKNIAVWVLVLYYFSNHDHLKI